MPERKNHKHEFWREDLGKCHNPAYGCWCCRCSGGFMQMCKCPCHREDRK